MRRLAYILAKVTYNLGLGFAALEYCKRTTISTHRRSFQLAISSIVLAHLVSFLLFLLHCQPIEKAWMPGTDGRCLATKPLFYGTSIAMLVTNLVAILLPIPLLCKLRLTRAERVRSIALILLGLLTPVCSLARICQIETMIKHGDSTMLVVWGTLENCVGVSTDSTFTICREAMVFY